MLARGFIEVHPIGFKSSTYIAIEHIIRIKVAIIGTNNAHIGELILNGAPGQSESNRVKTKETVEEIMTLINKERELIRAMEKAAS